MPDIVRHNPEPQPTQGDSQADLRGHQAHGLRGPQAQGPGGQVDSTTRAIRAMAAIKLRVCRPGAWRVYRQLLTNQQLSSDELSEVAWRKTLRLIDHAIGHVPFYARRYRAAGVQNARDLKRPEDFELLPVLTRQDLRDSLDELFADNVPRRHCRKSSTGGSTGEPVSVYHDRRFPSDMLGWRMLEWWGLHGGDSRALIYHHTTPLQRLALNVAHWPARRIFMDASSLNPQRIQEFAVRLCRSRPRLVYSYGGAAQEVALCIRRLGLAVPPLAAVWVTACPLALPQRRLLEEAFGAPAYDQYGTCEVFWLAAQCRVRQGLHVFADGRTIEFLDQRHRSVSAGQMGQIALTDLENYAFPIIRYLVGDQGRALQGRCACGISLPLMDAVVGRESDRLVLPDGTLVAALAMTCNEHPEAVIAFQIHQHADGSVTFRVVPNPADRQADRKIEAILSGLRRILRHQVPVRLERVSRIDGPGGKLKYVISDCPRDWS